MFDVEAIRKEFPILERKVYDRPLVYLDSGATAQKPEVVIRTVDRLHRELNANIHRGVHYLSEVATEQYEEARAEVARFIGAKEKEEIIFTAGATASINLVAYAWSEKFLHAGDNILISELEHHSNIVPWQLAAERKGAEIRVLPFDDEGRLRVELLPELLDDTAVQNGRNYTICRKTNFGCFLNTVDNITESPMIQAEYYTANQRDCKCNNKVLFLKFNGLP